MDLYNLYVNDYKINSVPYPLECILFMVNNIKYGRIIKDVTDKEITFTDIKTIKIIKLKESKDD